MIHIFLSGPSSGLGSSLYELLSSRSNTRITNIGRNKPKKMRKQDFFLKKDFQELNKFKFDISDDISKIIFISNAGSIEPINLAAQVKIQELITNHMINFISPYSISGVLTRISIKMSIPLHIVNISSGAASHGIAGWSAYCSSKAAIKIALDCLAEENENVNLIHLDPGILDTDMQRTIREVSSLKMPGKKKFIDYYNQGKLKTPSNAAIEIINAIDELLE